MSKRFGDSRPIQTARFYRFIKHRLRSNRDCKILITSRNSETGTSKTTLALHLAKALDPSWHIGKHFHDGYAYADYYMESLKGDVLIVDDFQFSADSRRGTSKVNVLLSQYWSIMRVKNVVSIVTLPSSSMLDKRFLELADIRINVERRGLAVPYRIIVNDFSGRITQWAFKDELGVRENILYGPLDHDPLYREIEVNKDKFVKKRLKEMKAERN